MVVLDSDFVRCHSNLPQATRSVKVPIAMHGDSGAFSKPHLPDAIRSGTRWSDRVRRARFILAHSFSRRLIWDKIL